MYKWMNACIETLCSRICNDFFLPETNLFYDYLSDTGNSGLGHLPEAAEIIREYPNPCGWGTGMEDCALHAGSMIDSLCILQDYSTASKALHGLFRLVTAHGKKGFVARGISPFAPDICYPNSSRDQFTLAVFGAWRIFCCSPSNEDRMMAVAILKMISEYCKETVVPANIYNLLRHDGRHGLVSKMWHNNPHECLRLPMIYAAAGVASGDDFLVDLARRLLDEGIARTLTMDDSRNWWDIELSQLQLSIKLLIECNAFPDFGEGLNNTLRKTSYLAKRELKILVDRAKYFNKSWNIFMPDWRKCDMRIIVSSEEDGGIRYKSVVFPTDFHQVSELLRGIGNLLTTISGAEDFSDCELEDVWNVLSEIDYGKVNSGGIIQLLQGLLNTIRIEEPDSLKNIF